MLHPQRPGTIGKARAASLWKLKLWSPGRVAQCAGQDRGGGTEEPQAGASLQHASSAASYSLLRDKLPSARLSIRAVLLKEC